MVLVANALVSQPKAVRAKEVTLPLDSGTIGWPTLNSAKVLALVVLIREILSQLNYHVGPDPGHRVGLPQNLHHL